MEFGKKFILVEENSAPDFLVKVLKAKNLLACGKAKNSSEACKLADVSRSAYYKYKDSVYSYDSGEAGKLMTVYLSLMDRPGILSSVISALYEHKANIITVNQNIPADGAAAVTISFRLSESELDSALQSISKTDGVIKVKLI